MASQDYTLQTENLENCFYVGNSYATFNVIQSRGVHSLQPFYSAAINKIKTILINLDSYFNDHLVGNLSDTISYNRYISNFVDYFIKAQIIIDLVEKYKKIILIVDNHEQVEVFNKFLVINNYTCQVVLKKFVARLNWIKYLKFLKVRLSAIFYEIIMILSLRKIRAQLNKPFNFQNQVQNKEVFLFSWINDASFEHDNFWQANGYFGGFPDFLKKNKSVGILAKIIYGSPDYKKIFAKAIQNCADIVFIQDYISVLDVFKAHFEHCKLLYNANVNLKVADIDFSSIIQFSLYKDLLGINFSQAVMHYQAFKNFLSLTTNGKIKIFYPFENQAWERALLLAKSIYGKNVECIAYQFFPIPINLLIQCFSNLKAKSKLLPDQICTSDLISHQEFVRQNLNVYKLASFRYEKQLNLNPNLEANFNKKIILCATFLDSDESIELSLKSAEATKNTQFTLWINFHPLISTEVKNNIATMLNIYNHVKICDANIKNLLFQVGLVLYNASSICYDAILNGIPCVYVKSDMQVDLNRFDDSIKSFLDPKEGMVVINEIFSNKQYYVSYAQSLLDTAKSRIFNVNQERLEKVLQ